MIKATATLGDGKTLLMIGLSFGNLDKFRSDADTYIRIDGKEMGLPVDVMLFSGQTEAHLQAMMAGLIGPETEVRIDPKVKA